MIVQTGDEYELSLSEPEVVGEDQLVSQVTSGPKCENLYIQTPSMEYDFDGTMTRVYFDASKIKHCSFYKYIRRMESVVCDRLSDLSATYFDECVSGERIYNTLLRSAIKLPDALGSDVYMVLHVPADCEIYDHKGATLDRAALSSVNTDTGTCARFLLNVKSVRIASTQARIDLEVVQVQKVALRSKTEPKPLPKLPKPTEPVFCAAADDDERRCAISRIFKNA